MRRRAGVRSAPARRAACALGLVLGLVLGGRAHAQEVEARVHVRTGFVPDPAVLEGHVTATRDAAAFGTGCAGFVGERASHVLEFDSAFAFLRVFATGPRDLMLAVRLADGRWLCSEDRFGPHPSVEGEFPAGRTEVWVGARQSGISTDYAVRLTELASVRPGLGNQTSAAMGVALARDVGLAVDGTDGVYGNLRIRRGFLPDPRVLEGIAGGVVEASALGASCLGRVSASPSHVVTLVDDFDFLQFYLDAASYEDLTLVVLTPTGRFFCDVGAEERPEVSAGAWAAGTYRIWVGTTGAVAWLEHRLGVSEVRRVR